MTRRVVALLLCLSALLLCFAGCSHGSEDKGAYIRMYLTEEITDLDPLNAFDNEANLQIVTLLFEGLFTADDNGKPEKALADSYKYKVDKDNGTYTLTIKLKDTKWSDGVKVTSTDAQYAFWRVFSSDVSNPAVVLLYDVKNARAIAEGNDSVDHLGVTVVDQETLEIEFERDIDVDRFLLSLCSPALYPLRADIVEGNKNWAKKPGTLVCSGPFMVRSMSTSAKDGFIIERNSYYFRNRSKDDLDKYVTPFRIVIDYSTPADTQLANYNTGEAGTLYYFGHIPLSARSADSELNAMLKKLKVTDAPSTHVYYLNENAMINGKALFADAAVRKALSLAIDRDAIVNAMVYAKAADGLVPYTILNRTDKKTEFRKKAESAIASSANLEEAKQLLNGAGIKASDYTFTITVNAKDEDHKLMASLIQSAWKSLGFNVKINELGTYEIKEKNNLGQEEATGMFASKYQEALKSGSFEVIALDLVANSPDAFAYLAPFAKAFSGNPINMDTSVNPNYKLTPHITGYDSEEYNAKIEAAYNAQKEKDRAELLHEAEAILMRDMPVIPIVYNQDVSLCSNKLSKIRSNFFCNHDFTKTKLSGYWKVALRDQFIVEDDGSEEE